jgi:hypothetical protein
VRARVANVFSPVAQRTCAIGREEARSAFIQGPSRRRVTSYRTCVVGAVRVAAIAVSLIGLAACGSSGSSRPSTKPSATATPTPGTSSVNLAQSDAVTAADLQSAGFLGMTQVSDGPVNDTPETDIRSFVAADGTTHVTTLVVVTSNAASASVEYGQLTASASDQVEVKTKHISNPISADQSVEYSGNRSDGSYAVAIAFTVGSVACLIFVSSAKVIPADAAGGLAEIQAYLAATI